nr:hypothetical protein [Synechococcus sp. CCY9201]
MLLVHQISLPVVREDLLSTDVCCRTLHRDARVDPLDGWGTGLYCQRLSTDQYPCERGLVAAVESTTALPIS